MTETLVDSDILSEEPEDEITQQMESPLFPYLGFVPPGPLRDSPGSIEAWDALPEHIKAKIGAYNQKLQEDHAHGL